MKADGDLIGGNKRIGNDSVAGGASIGGGIHLNLGSAPQPRRAELEYEQFVDGILGAGGALDRAREHLEQKRRELGLVRSQATDIETLAEKHHSARTGQGSAERTLDTAKAAQSSAAPPPKPTAAAPIPTGQKRTIWLDDAKRVGMDLSWIGPGRFQMGDSTESPVHGVTISRGFWMGKTPVTQGQWEAVLGTNPSGFKGPRRPVETVSWEDCQEFIQNLNARLSGEEASLPTEAEWEYACRAGSRGKWCFGDAEAMLAQYGWFRANSGEETHDVGLKKPNAWGLYDVHGNVWEWCSDWYGEYGPEEVMDPAGAEYGEIRVVRGGGWLDVPAFCRSALRSGFVPAIRVVLIGFRLVLR